MPIKGFDAWLTTQPEAPADCSCDGEGCDLCEGDDCAPSELTAQEIAITEMRNAHAAALSEMRQTIQQWRDAAGEYYAHSPLGDGDVEKGQVEAYEKVLALLAGKETS